MHPYLYELSFLLLWHLTQGKFIISLVTSIDLTMKLTQLLLILIVLLLIWSAINPFDYFTWLLEVLPVLLGAMVLILTYKRFPFSKFVYTLIFLHCVILIIGGHYTYAEVPLFDWIQVVFNQTRNNYDKLGHFAQGFVPAIITREILIRKEVVSSNGWLNFIVVCIAMAISVTYEFIEWAVSLGTGEGGDSFLGTQGYIWDTQSDMLYASIGAVLALIVFGKYHSRQINKLNF
jgi:putative membrane protein